jgi:N-methylhydantoinase A/oxoprolinase/acetone carboxylase beta subunit
MMGGIVGIDVGGTFTDLKTGARHRETRGWRLP